MNNNKNWNFFLYKYKKFFFNIIKKDININIYNIKIFINLKILIFIKNIYILYLYYF